MTCFVLFFLPILLYLSYWQISRGVEKKEIWETYSISKILPPLIEKELLSNKVELLFYRSVVIKGSYIEKSFLLDNRTYRKEKGFEVFTPFKSDNNRVYLINRGWTNGVEELGFVAPVGSQQIEGVVSPFNKYGLDLSKEKTPDSFPIVVQELTHPLASSLLGENINIEHLVIQLSAASRGAFEPIWGPTEIKASRHWGYAVQWLGLALALLGLYVYFGFKQSSKK